MTKSGTGQSSEKIFILCPHDLQAVNGEAATGSTTFTQRPRGRKENKNIIGVNRVCERFTVPDVPLKQLKASYPHEYNSFRCMKYRRCGKVGNNICHPDIDSFPKFLAAFGPCPDPEYTLDRLDPNDLEYAPGKCEWASKQRQAENKTNTKYLTTSDGTCLHVSEWSRLSKIPRRTIHRRINELGWSVDDAVRVKVGGKRSPSKSPDKPRTRSLFPDNPPNYLKTMLDQWTAGLKEHHDYPIFLLEWKHIKTLEYIHEGLLRCGVPPEDVITDVVRKWCRFSGYHDAPRHSKPPRTPDLNFLKGRITEAVMYYLNNGGIRLRDKYPDQYSQPAEPGEFDGLL